MRQYQVPQFITVEDKVFGPFTIKQFIYLAAGSVLIFGARILLAPLLFWPIAAVVGGLAASLAFLKINEQPFPIVVKNMIFYMLRPRLYIWRQESPQKAAKPEERTSQSPIISIPKITSSKLSDLAWSLDVKLKVKENNK